MVKTNVLVIAVKNFKGRDKLIDYFLLLPDGESIYAFSRKYTDNTYRMCRGGVRLNDLLTKKSHDTGIMNLVKRMKFMLPYLKEEYQVA
ncbi:MAG: hypothetical protein K6G75_05915 [Lachnospiraceae bacterium]|nr:hypothetical protein [Lachnospiraceae bacterium]